MKAKIVYLQPQNAGLFRSQLRSDTLWGALCWAIRMVNKDGTNQLDKLLKAYDKPTDDSSSPFYLSSAFPYLYKQKGPKQHFLPFPHEPYRNPNPDKIPSDPQGLKELMRKQKREEKRKQWISWDTFAARFCRDGRKVPTNIFPKIGTRAMTHNSIDRTRLGTLDTQGGGMLFHTNENYLYCIGGRDSANWSAGLYFLVQGDFSPLEPALRFLEHFGLAGDRSTGKGRFRIDWEEIEIPEAEQPNARLCLSLYHPTEEEVMAIDGSKDRVCRYQLVDRQGRYILQKEHVQPGHFCFSEGSVFPQIDMLKKNPGKNKLIREEDQNNHAVYRYGYGFMIDVKIL